MKDKLTEDFILAITEIEIILLQLGFKRYSIVDKGLATFVKFKNKDCLVEFIFGPSDWDIEMIIFLPNDKFAFKDLLQIPDIFEWINNNRYISGNKRILKNELIWFVDLLRFSLPIVNRLVKT